MKTTIISYSMTGNNKALAASIASELSAEHINVTEPKTRTNGKVALDMIFNRTPKVSPAPSSLDVNDFLIFVAPVWMGQVASPLRAYMKELKGTLNKFAFVSISGGSLNDNPKLPEHVTKKFGQEATAVIDMHIADLLPSGKEASMKDSSSYRLTEEHKKELTSKIVTQLKECIK